jgi:SAM-dependent methyltransferase
MSVPIASTYTEDGTAAEYWRHQRAIGAVGGELNAWKFEPYVRDDDVVLDFGCGGGFLLERLPGRMKLGVEPNPHARAEANRRGIYTYVSASEVESYSVDVVVSNHALEHVLAPLDELRELWRALRPGGRLVLVVPFTDWRKGQQRWPRPSDPDHEFYTWTPQLLHNLVTEAGFRSAHSALVAHAWHPRVSTRLKWLPRFLYEVHAWALAVGLNAREVHVVASRSL